MSSKIAITDLPKMGAPAERALLHAGYTRLTQLTRISEKELLQLHGMGPKAMGRLKEAMQLNKLRFRK